MCHYQTLYHNDKIGYAILCGECEKVQLAYCNLVMTFSQQDFTDFKCWISKIKNGQPERPNPYARCIMVQAPCQGIQLLLSAIEFDELSIMLETADTELQSLQLLDLFNS